MSILRMMCLCLYLGALTGCSSIPPDNGLISDWNQAALQTDAWIKTHMW